MGRWRKVVKKVVTIGFVTSLVLVGIYELCFRTCPLIEMARLTITSLLLQIGGVVLILPWLILRIKQKKISQGSIKKRKIVEESLKGIEGYPRKIGVVAVAISSMIVSVKEEIVFRGPLLIIVLFLELPILIKVLLMVIDGIIFGLAHFKETSSFPIFITTSWLGIVLSWLVIETASLVPSMLCHFIWDWFLKSLFYLSLYSSRKRIKPNSWK